jgi:hypothetical protein
MNLDLKTMPSFSLNSRFYLQKYAAISEKIGSNATLPTAINLPI